MRVRASAAALRLLLGCPLQGPSRVTPPAPQNLHVYISEHEHFTDFNATSALFWEQHDLVYGDWTSGENSDGCYQHFAELDIPQVGAAPGLRPRAAGPAPGDFPRAHSQSCLLQLGPRAWLCPRPACPAAPCRSRRPLRPGLPAAPRGWGWNWPGTLPLPPGLCVSGFKPVKDQRPSLGGCGHRWSGRQPRLKVAVSGA